MAVRRVWLRWLLAAALLAGCTPTISSVSGLHIHSPVRTAHIEALKAAGGSWTRTDLFFWDRIEPQRLDPSVYDWSQVDEEALLAIASSGVKTIAVTLFAPSWAQKYPGVACGPFREDALERFGDFMAALVTRYSYPPYNILYWEIGNEPEAGWYEVAPDSGFGCWGEPGETYYGGMYYGRMLQSVYDRMKAANPDVQVVIGGLMLDCDPLMPPENRDCSPALFLEGILQVGGGNYFDGVSFHAYDNYRPLVGGYGNGNWHSSWNETGPLVGVKARFIRSLLAQYGVEDKLLLATEVALLCGNDQAEDYCRTPVFRATKAAYIAEVNTVMAASGLHAGLWYGFGGWRASGLSPNTDPENFAVYQFSNKMLAGAVFQRELIEWPGVRGYEFVVDRGVWGQPTLWVLWAVDGGTHDIQLDVSASAVYNLNGQSVPAGLTLTVTGQPIYVER